MASLLNFPNYPFSHNPGSRKWLYLNCNYYWEKPIFHFNDYGRKGIIPLETSMEMKGQSVMPVGSHTTFRINNFETYIPKIDECYGYPK